MWCLSVALLVVVAGGGGVKYTPTKGEVWPLPREENKSNLYYTFNPDNFNFQMVGAQCALLVQALMRYRGVLAQGMRRHARIKITSHVSDDLHQGAITRLLVNLTQPCEMYPHHKMNESYNLVVSDTCVLTASAVWGILRGLETFSQLFYYTDDYKEVWINWTLISDGPRHRHRGLLIDSARHFLPTQTILLLLDAMEMNKMNVLHWHLVDDQSFPYQSSALPELSKMGAYHESLVYTSRDIEEVVQYARNRGVRLIPEFDMPGHTRSWGAGYPSLMTSCPGLRSTLNPIYEDVYQLLAKLFKEVRQRFPEQYIHLGGDEVDNRCWKSNAETRKFMETKSILLPELHALFLKRVRSLLGGDVRTIVWEDAFRNVGALDPNITVQVWKGSSPDSIYSILNAGHEVILSSCWYLDKLDVGINEMYTCSRLHVDPRLQHQIVGGEACAWGEMIDQTNIMTMVWPRTCAVAEVLWSSENTWEDTEPGTFEDKDVIEIKFNIQRRLEEQVCRMLRRGVQVAPALGPGYCVRRP